MNDNQVSDKQVGAVIYRAGWLKDSSRYCAMSDWRLQIGRYKDCHPVGIVDVWQFDGISIYTTTAVFESAEGLTLLSPFREGVEVAAINYQYPPFWRWLLYHLSVAPGNYVAWVILLIWLGLIIRAQRKGFEHDKG